MADLLQSGLQWLGGKMDNFVASDIEYGTPDAARRYRWQATISPSQRLLETGDVAVSYEDLDFSISFSNFTPFGRMPLRGDTIKARIGGIWNIYEVHENGSRDAWEWTDSSKTRVRVHTNQKGKTTP